MKTESSLSKSAKKHPRPEGNRRSGGSLFARHVLGVEVLGKEAEILRSQSKTTAEPQ